MTDRYTVERKLGSGGMATVFLARDTVLDRPVALKVLAEHLADDDQFRERFLREARLAAKFVHPNVVQVYDADEDERGPFIVMEYVEGHTLADELKRRGRLPPAEVVGIGVQICAALDAAHAAGLVHRDIKPQNILLRPDGRVKIADFGIARSLAATRHTEIGTVLGTAAYLAPEQARGEEVTPAADIYSLGVVLYELLTGRTPFEADTLPEMLLKREHGELVPPRDIVPGIPLALERVVMRCLALKPEHRPSSAGALARELEGGSDEPPTVPMFAVTKARTPPRRGLLVLAAVILALIAAGLALALTSGSSTPSSPPTTTTAPTTTTPTTTAPTTTAATTTAPPTTTDQAIALVRTAITQAAAAGQLDSGALDDLNHRLDNLAQDPNQLNDLQNRLADLTQNGQLTSDGYTAIETPLTQLAALLPAVLPKHGKGHSKNGNGDGG
ncbi:MAG TPA: serine/threonine-protein kinase [Gaiellaceae bacterium]|nr:serine/threonine-protein kinase [Gaiellaceae bacterium]